MSETNDLKIIKKMYGERFMHLCRELFPTILEQEGLLPKVLEENFAGNSRSLYNDIEDNGLRFDFKDFIYSKVDVEQEEIKIIEKKTPYELLEEAGYDLYECKTEKDIQSFKKYYKKGEELCTFNGGRLDRCVVFWAVKKNADEIKRSDFKNPQREDEYGTSVMSIQFSKGENCTLSIKNRYNHKVNNPDATYGNDLDRIIPGLRQSFEELLAERGMNLGLKNVEKFRIPNYVVAPDGKYYKYNFEDEGIYFCPGNVVIDCASMYHGYKIKRFNPEKQMLIDRFIVDKEKKTVKMYAQEYYRDIFGKDAFVDGFKNIEKIEETWKKEEDRKTKLLKIKKKDSEAIIEIELDEDNNIIRYRNDEITKIGDHFLDTSTGLETLELRNVKSVGRYFASGYNKIKKAEFKNLENIEEGFLQSALYLESLRLPKVKDIDTESFMEDCLNEYDMGKGSMPLNELELPKKFFEEYRIFKELEQIVEGNEGKVIKVKDKKKISKKDIADLSKRKEITSSEINSGKETVENCLINDMERELYELLLNGEE